MHSQPTSPGTQNGGYLRTGCGRTPVTGRDRFFGLVSADLADSVRPDPGRRPSAWCGRGRAKGLGAI